MIFDLILGTKCDLNSLFKSSDLVDATGKGIKVAISEDKFEEYVPIIEEVLGEYSYLISSIQQLYSRLVLNEALGDCTTLSQAMVNRYNAYQQDLKNLKNLFKKYNCMDSYQKIFKDKSDAGYYAYTNRRGKVIDNKDSQTRFYNLVKKELSSNVELAQDELTIRILNQMEEKKFLVLLNTKANSAIPYQLQLQELEVILEKQGKFYELLRLEEDKIKSLLTFRIPYYIGPLNANSQFAWIKKNKEEEIYPWNFNEVVDQITSAELFINKMTNFCTYLKDEPVLPVQSILYSRFKLLNELNKIRINEKFLSHSEKEMIITNLFLRYKTVTKDQFIEEYKKIHKGMNKVVLVEGFQQENKVASSLRSEQDFIRILGKITPENLQMVEDIIYWLTVFTEDKMVRNNIEKYYKDKLTSNQINQIVALKYSDWGKLSRKLLEGIKVVTSEQKRLSIMDCLNSTNLSFRQLLNDKKYDFKGEIEKLYPIEKKERLSQADVNEIYGSPDLKRGIWQCIQIIQEIEHVMGCQPKHIFLEFARSDESSKRIKSRYKQLETIYSNHMDEVIELKDLKSELKKYDKELSKIKYYLYFTQHGKCMYTKESLDINRLSDYQLDYIVPESLIKDDSLDNIVLVKRPRNQDKLDYKMPLDVASNPEEIKCWWERLYQMNLITKKKYYNLTTTKFTEPQIKRFINRQLVETRQISKEVATLLQQVYENKVVTIKAQLGHDLRDQFDLPKCREINDYHHAHDAYLVSVIGSYLLKKYPKLESKLIYDDYLKQAKKRGTSNKYGFIISSMKETTVSEETGEVIWDQVEHKLLLEKTLGFKDCFITKRLDEPNEFYKATLQGKVYGNQHKEQDPTLIKKGVNLIPMKKGMDVKKYGGYTGVNEAYYSVIEYETGKKKKPIEKKLVGIPVYVACLFKRNPNAIEDYLLNKGYKNFKFLMPKVMKNQLVEVDGEPIYLASSSEWNNARQLTLDSKSYKLISRLIKLFNDNQINQIDETLLMEVDSIYDLLVLKLQNNYGVFSSIADKLMKSRERFTLLSPKEKIDLIKNFLSIMHANASNGNLKNIGLSDREGRLSKKNLNISKAIFIHQSITGLFETRVKL